MEILIWESINHQMLKPEWYGTSWAAAGIFWRDQARNGLKFGMLMYSDHLQNHFVFGHGLLVFLIVAPFWLSETDKIRVIKLNHSLTHLFTLTPVVEVHPLKVRSHMRGWMRAGAGGKLTSTQIITCVHTCAVAERRRSGSKNRSARNGSNTQFTAPASKPRAPNHHCPQEMADLPASAPRMCEHTLGSGVAISKSARLRSATAPRMCKHSLMPLLQRTTQFTFHSPQYDCQPYLLMGPVSGCKTIVRLPCS